MEKHFLKRYQYISDCLFSAPPSLGAASAENLRETYLKMHGKLQTDLSMEVGAREATYSIQFRERYGDHVAVCAIEGSPKSYTYFSDKLDFRAKHINYMHVVMSSSDGSVDFYEYEGEEKDVSLGFSSTHIRASAWNGDVMRHKVKVKSVKGDSLINSQYPDKHSIALWIDVEGAQKEVLSSLSGTFLSGKVNSVFIEVEKKKLWPAQYMRDKDVITHMQGLGFVPFLRDAEYEVQYNIIFLNKKFLDKSYEVFQDYYIALLQKSLRSLISDLPSSAS